MWKRIKAKAEGLYKADTKHFSPKEWTSFMQITEGFPATCILASPKKRGAREPMYERGTEIFNRRQISIVSMEECDEIAEAMGIPNILPEWLGANIAISGFPSLTSLKEGSRIIFPSGAPSCVREKMIRAFSRERSFNPITSIIRNWLRGLCGIRWAKGALSVSSNGRATFVRAIR